MPRKRRLPNDPLDVQLARRAMKTEAVPRDRLTVPVPGELANRLRNAAYWTRQTLAAVCEEGIRREVRRLEKQNGRAFRQRRRELQPGRPPK